MSSITQRFANVLAEIDRTIDRPMDITALADAAACSRFHFQRQFTAILGVSVAEYRRLLRLKRAGHQLAFRRETAVTEIAFDAAYENLESFSRAFKRVFGQTPSVFRQSPDWTTWHKTYDPLLELKGQIMPAGDLDFDSVRINRFPETLVARLEHRGPPGNVPASVRKFIAWRKDHGTPPSKSATFNLCYDDPKTTPPEDFRMDICCAVKAPVAKNSMGVVTGTIPEGRCAVLRHRGPLDFAETVIRALYRDWLPQSGEELRDFPLFVQRITFYPDVPEHEAETDIFLPLK